MRTLINLLLLSNCWAMYTMDAPRSLRSLINALIVVDSVVHGTDIDHGVMKTFWIVKAHIILLLICLISIFSFKLQKHLPKKILYSFIKFYFSC